MQIANLNLNKQKQNKTKQKDKKNETNGYTKIKDQTTFNKKQNSKREYFKNNCLRPIVAK